jgi:hypothetical protein
MLRALGIRFLVIAAVVSCSISLGGCLDTTGFGSVGRVPVDLNRTSVSKYDPHPWEQKCDREGFPQCGGGAN